jgi:FHA domain-containing protein
MTKTKAPAPHLLVRGHGGVLAGAEHTLAPGETLVVGRSRTCDLSLRNTDAFRHREDAANLLLTKEFNRVSRVHCEIAYREDGQVEIRDLSRNGTLVDGTRVGRRHLVRLGGARASIELVDGTWGTLLVSEAPAAVE